MRTTAPDRPAMRVLLVEDSPSDARLVSEALREVPDLAFSLDVASSLGDAIRALTGAHAPDVVLLDLALPDSYGYQAVTGVVGSAPGAPVVVLTGHDDDDTGLEALRLGAQDYLRKRDLAPGALIRAIRYAIERKRAQNRERFLADVANLLASSPDYDETLRSLVRLAVASLCDYCVIDMVGEDGAMQRVEAASRDPSVARLAQELLRYPLSPERQPLQAVLETRRAVRRCGLSPEFLDQVAHDEEHGRVLRDLRPRSFIAAPMYSRDELIGCILCVSTSDDFDEEDQEMVERVAGIAAPELTNAQLYKRARDAVRARDRVLAIVAHDLRNPLNAITMSAALLQDPGCPDEQRARGLQVIRRSADRMDRLIQDLLDVASIESDRLRLQLAEQDPATLVEEAVELNASLAASRGLTMETQLGAREPKPVRADHDRILQVLSNLLGNAIKFTPEGGRIVARTASRAGETRFSVADTGPGISPEDQEHLFTPFWQARRITSEGAGLGLSIARGIVEAHGGQIGVDSEVGRGTVVWFTLPDPPTPPDPPASEAGGSADPASPQRSA